MKILFVTQYGTLAASSRTRVFQYLPHLSERGLKTQVITVLPDHFIGATQIRVEDRYWGKFLYYLRAFCRTFSSGLLAWWYGRGCDVLFIQKVIFPLPIRLLMRISRPLLAYDFDDAIFTTETPNDNWLSRLKTQRNASGLPGMLNLANVALVENDYNAAIAARYTSHVEIITGPIDTCRYCATDTAKCKENAIILGWIGSATTVDYLLLLEKPLARLARRFSHLRLFVIGAEDFHLRGVSVVAKAWSMEEEIRDLNHIDIGLMPLPENIWTRGKGGYKLLQYMAMGLPVVTSPVGINRQIVSHGINGFWARDDVEWEDCLARLIDDHALRTRMGRRGRDTVEKHYSLDIAARRLVRLLRQMPQSQ